jgi:hypothetical protein
MEGGKARSYTYPRRDNFLFILPVRHVTVNDKAKISPPTTGGGSGLRTVALLGILAVLIGACAYDYLYAQKQVQKLHDEIFAYCDDTGAKPNGNTYNKPTLYTPSDIHKRLGEKFNGGKDYLPSKVTAILPGHIVETYSVMGGAVIKSYDVHVIYTANDPASAKEGRSEAKFSTLCLGEFPKGDLVPQGKAASETPLTPPPGPPSLGGSIPGAGGGGRRPSGAAASSGAKDEAKKEEEKKEEGKTEEPKPEGEAKLDGEKKPEGESKPEGEKKEEPKPEAKPSEPEKPAEVKPASEKPPEEKPAEKPADPKL